ncbi:circularly permuted type 2 ATP-grasp protein [Aureimonas psammosilenae]|uniref:circularly permuted type 2 ATP-grasp protein n=1 Tax=Aureimonas psammosilenae TaxID=2495496 RepID=UPI001260B95C|nr:circularly permuted type 2 ATP-grasp protein [Aureimonas psammosilenae]
MAAKASDLLQHYRPGEAHDEMMGPDRKPRPHYRPLIEALSAMTGEERTRRADTARQYLREAGVFYRVQGGAGGPEEGERTWPLAFPPLLLERREWEALEAGLRQRARFLELLLADLYGERSVIAEGLLPSALLGRNPEFLHPLSEQGRTGEPLIHFIAVDLARGADGRWRVLGDRAQAPSGAGFALENRVATARAFPELNAAMRVERLAGFFVRFREQLLAMNRSGGGRIGVLTPGPLNETYFEHAYLARYLGLQLLEGGDLAVRGSRLFVRTVEGLAPMSVLWRRLDGDFADPIELFGGSRIGTPGLVSAVRAGHLRMVNALGSGLLESPGLFAFQQALATRLIGEELALETSRTWWCGRAKDRAFVSANRERLAVLPAFPPRFGTLSPGGNDLFAAMDADGEAFVGQEIPALSTAPVLINDRLEPRAFVLRVFLARDGEDWHVMPGGFARIASEGGARSVSLQSGGFSADVWIATESEVAPVSLIAPTSQRFLRRVPGTLPSRAADNLFWLGRYVERVEVAARLLRLHALRLAEGARDDSLALRLEAALRRCGVDPNEGARRDLAHLASSAFHTASRIRDRFSPDGWRVLGEVVELLSDPEDGDRVRLTSALLTRLSSFAGLVGENMYQFTGWRFLRCGRFLERGLTTAFVGSALVGDDLPEGALEALLDFTDSRVTYRRRHSVAPSRETVLDLAVLDPLNPRSVAFQVNGLGDTLAGLPGMRAGETPGQMSRRAKRLQVRLATGVPGEVDAAFLTRIVGDFTALSDLLTERYFAGAEDETDERAEGE